MNSMRQLESLLFVVCEAPKIFQKPVADDNFFFKVEAMNILKRVARCGV